MQQRLLINAQGKTGKDFISPNGSALSPLREITASLRQYCTLIERIFRENIHLEILIRISIKIIIIFN